MRIVKRLLKAPPANGHASLALKCYLVRNCNNFFHSKKTCHLQCPFWGLAVCSTQGTSPRSHLLGITKTCIIHGTIGGGADDRRWESGGQAGGQAQHMHKGRSGAEPGEEVSGPWEGRRGAQSALSARLRSTAGPRRSLHTIATHSPK